MTGIKGKVAIVAGAAPGKHWHGCAVDLAESGTAGAAPE